MSYIKAMFKGEKKEKPSSSIGEISVLVSLSNLRF